MNKYLLFLLPTFVFSQQTLQTINQDFDTSHSSNVESIIRLNDTKSFAVFSPYYYDFNNLHLIDLERKKYEIVRDLNYTTYSPSHIFSYDNKLFFKSSYNLYHYDGFTSPSSFLSITDDEVVYIPTESGLYFILKGNYNNKFYFYDGSSASQIYLNYNANFIHKAKENKIYYSSKNNLNQYNLEEIDKENHKISILSTNVLVDENGNGIEHFQDNLFYTADRENDKFLYRLNASKEEFIIEYQSNNISYPLKVEQQLTSIKEDHFLLFKGKDENNLNSLFVINEDLVVNKLPDLLHNNIAFNIATKSIKYKDENNLYFTAYNSDQSLATVWMYNQEMNTIKLISNSIPPDIKEFYIKNNHLIYKNSDTILAQNLSTNSILSLTQNFSEITYLTLQDDYFYFSANEPIHGNELYRLNPNDFSYELWMDLNRNKDTNVSQLMKNNDLGYFISDNTMYQYDGISFIPISEKNETLFPTQLYNQLIKNYKQIEEINNKLIFRNINNELISVDKTTKSVNNLGLLLSNTNSYLDVDHFIKYDNKVYFTTYQNSSYKIKVTDGTNENTNTLLSSNYDNSILNPNYFTYHNNHNKIYFLSHPHNTSYLHAIDPENDTVTTIADLNITNTVIHQTFGNYILIEGYNSSTRQYELYISDGQSLGTKIPVSIGAHYVSGTTVKDNIVYFTFNNRFYSYDIDSRISNQIFASNYERLFNLKSCGDSFYFEDEYKKQIFRTTGNTTTLIKKFTEDYKNIDGICHNSTMFYLNDDDRELNISYAKKNYIVASTNQQHFEIEIEHEFSDLGNLNSITFKDFNIVNNKMLLNYYNYNVGKELLIGDLSNLTLNTEDYSTDQQYLKSQIKVFPNPTSDYLNIDTKDEIEEIHIYDSLGQLIKIIITPKNNINIGQFAKGIYYIKIKTISTTETKKIIKN